MEEQAQLKTVWIRKNNLIGAAVAAALLALFGLFFMDPVLRWGLVKAGELAAGAKVAVGSVRTGLLRGRVVVRDVAVANKSEPFKNLFELDEAAFQLEPAEALKDKIVIDDASITGLRFGTPRKTSGALRREPPSGFSLKVQKALEPAKEAALSKLGDAAAPVKTELDPKSLAGVKALEEAEAKLKAIPDRWKQRLAPEKIQGDLKAIDESVKSLKGGGDLLGKLKAAREVQSRLKAMLKDVQSSKEGLREDFDSLQAQIKSAEELKGKDLKGLMAAAGLPSLDAESLTRRLVGPAAADKLSTALYWIDWVRKRSKASSAAAKPEAPPKRRRGLTVEFPLARSYPAFLLKRARLSGTIAGLFKGQDMALEGVLSDVTSNPPLLGRPARLVLKGDSPRAGASLGLEALLDQTKDPGATSLSFRYAGIPLAGAELGDKELGAELTGGSARVDGAISVVGEDWKGRVNLQAEGASLKPRVGFSGPAAGFAADALAAIKRFSVTVTFEGQQEDLHFSASSDLGGALAEGVKKGFSSQLAAQRKVLEGKLNALYAEKTKALRGQASGLQASLMAPLDKEQAAVENALKEAATKSLGKQPLPGLNKLFGR